MVKVKAKKKLSINPLCVSVEGVTVVCDARLRAVGDVVTFRMNAAILVGGVLDVVLLLRISVTAEHKAGNNACTIF